MSILFFWYKNSIISLAEINRLYDILCRLFTEPLKGHFLSFIYKKRQYMLLVQHNSCISLAEIYCLNDLLYHLFNIIPGSGIVLISFLFSCLNFHSNFIV